MHEFINKQKILSWFILDTDEPLSGLLSPVRALMLSLITGVYAMLIISILEPFGISLVNDERIGTQIIFSILQVLAVLLSIVSGYWFSRIVKRNTLVLTVSFNLLIFILSSTLLSFLAIVFLEINSKPNLLDIVVDELIISSVPVFLLLFSLQSTLSWEAKVNEYDKNSYENDRGKRIHIKSDTKKEVFVDPEQLILIQASQNYSTLYIQDKDKTHKTMLRVSMKSIEDQLSGHECFLRCHNSFIVNRNYIDVVSGNSRAYKFLLKSIDISVPVSRNFPKELIEEIKKSLQYG
ncbi:MAG: hypothetical protein C0594_02915 [Marinilabiliales bacterium]|nr:MAG: hypothetical protein C0594_02915 [Marinilabiliales bacterium]